MPLPAARARSEPRIPRARGLRAALALGALVVPRAALAWGSTMDPVFVYYPQRYCEGDRIALEVWDRARARWVAHPSHPVIRTDSCQLEDAGVLLNEIRWRCLAREHSAPGEAWSVGVRVFQPDVMQHCEVSRAGDGFGETEIHFSAPEPGATLADADGHAEIEGSVWIGGLAGDQYDVVIAIDTSARAADDADGAPPDRELELGAARATASIARSARDAHALPDPLAAQLAAARGFVTAVRERLGAVRIGIVSFPGEAASGALRAADASPGRSADGAEPLEARRELALSDDRLAIERALARIERRGRAGAQRFSDGLALAIDELFRPPDWPGAARPAARRLVLLAADGSGAFPFGAGAQADRDFRERNEQRARDGAARGVALHLFALGGVAELPPPFVDALLANPASSFTRVQGRDGADFFAKRVALPFLEAVSIHTAASGEATGSLEFASDGRFAASVPLEPGENRLFVRAATSDGIRREAPLVLHFDASAYRERLLAAEAARIRRIQRKQVTLEVVD